MNYSNLRSQISAAIKYPPKISAASLQEQLINIVNGLDLGALLLGVATPSLTPNTEANGFYFALQSGTYTNFPTINGQTITVDSSEVAIIVRSGNYWSKVHITTYPTIDPTTKHWMIGNEDTGVLAEGTTPHIDQESGNWMIGTYDTGIHAQGAPGKNGQDAYQPFKGTFSNISDLNAAYPKPNEGDTAHVEDTVDNATVLKVYDVVNGEWHDTGTTADSPVFGSGQFLSSVKIDETHLANPADGSLPKAEDVMQLKAKLEGVTAIETKVNAVVGTNVTTGAYVSGETGLLVTPNSSASSYAYFELAIPQGTNSIRFATGTKTSTAKCGYSIGHYEENVYVPTRIFYFDVSETTPPTGIVEKMIEVLEGETTFMATVAADSAYASITLDEFYCYLKSGESVGEELANKISTKDLEGLWKWKKNLISQDQSTYIKGGVWSNYGWTTESGTYAKNSNKLFLQDGVVYTASKVNVFYSSSACIITISRFDENDNFIGNFRPAAIRTDGTGGSNQDSGKSTFTYQKAEGEAYARIRLRYNSNTSYWKQAQLEVGNEVTAYCPYHSEKIFDIAKDSELKKTMEIAEGNKAIFDEHSIVIKNLINKDDWKTGGVYIDTGWTTSSATHGVVSNKLYLEEGTIYAASNVNAYRRGSNQNIGDSCIICISRFDSEDNFLGNIRPYGIITKTDKNPNMNTATSIFKYEKHRNEITGEIDEAYCRIRLRYNAGSTSSTYNDCNTAQLELGNKVTEYAEYEAFKDYLFENPGQNKVESDKKTIKLLAIGDSLLLEAFVYAPIMMKKMFPDVNLVVGIAYEGFVSHTLTVSEGSLAAFLTYLTTNNTHTVSYYTYNTDIDDWNSSVQMTMQNILLKEEWDCVVIRVNSGDGILTSGNVKIGENNADVYVTGYEDADYDYNNIVDRLRDEIMKVVKKPVKFGGLIPQKKPIITGTVEDALEDMNSQLKTTFDVANYYIEKSMFDFIIPEGTAIQNARYIPEINIFGALKDNPSNQTGAGFLDYDDSAKHLQDGIGREICGYSVCLKILEYEYRSIFGDKTPFDIDTLSSYNIPYKKGDSQPTGFKNHIEGESEEQSYTIDSYNNCLLRIMQKCVHAANKNPYQVQTNMSEICAADITELNSISEGQA